MSNPKGRCQVCGKKIKLDLKGQEYIIASHNKRILGEINPECTGTGLPPVGGNR